MPSTDIIPNLNDLDLATLYANALRLQAGEGRHRRAAADLVPLIESELAVRAAARPSAASKPRPARARKRATVVAGE